MTSGSTVAAKGVVVTGAGGALGRSVVEHFAESGLPVIAFHHRQGDLERTEPADGVARLVVDLLDQDAVDAAVQETGVDGLVCLAGARSVSRTLSSRF